MNPKPKYLDLRYKIIDTYHDRQAILKILSIEDKWNHYTWIHFVSSARKNEEFQTLWCSVHNSFFCCKLEKSGLLGVIHKERRYFFAFLKPSSCHMFLLLPICHHLFFLNIWPIPLKCVNVLNGLPLRAKNPQSEMDWCLIR